MQKKRKLKYTENVYFPDLPNNIDDAVDTVTNIIIDAAKISIPMLKFLISHRPVPW